MALLTLGPAGTFSERAAQVYLRQHPELGDMEFESSLPRVLQQLQRPQADKADAATCLHAIVPLENLVEGFVSPVLDGLLNQAQPATDSAQLFIVDELRIPVQFSLAATSQAPTKLYAQFVAQGQCTKALEQYQWPRITTASNAETVQKLLADNAAAALVPSHTEAELTKQGVQILASDIADTADNATRFVVLAHRPAHLEKQANTPYKTSLLLIDNDDHPGYLAKCLQILALFNVNLTSIVSRPTGAGFGQYHFFIDCDGHQTDADLAQALAGLRRFNDLIILGSYPSASIRL